MDPFTVETNATYGRYIVAAKDIKEGELILKERPVLIGAQIQGCHICFRCCGILECAIVTCRGCGIATLCSEDCQGENHTITECTTLKSSNLTALNLLSNPQIIMPFRCLIFREYNQPLWNQLNAMEAHLEQRRDTPIWNRHQKRVVEILTDLKQLTQEDLENDLVQKLCAILDVNSFEVRAKNAEANPMDSQNCLRGLYLKASLLTHDCIGNTLVSVDDDFAMTVHASKSIGMGEIIFFNYSNCLKGTYERRQHLRQGKYFDCTCARCSDPTELGTHMSSIKCSKCKTGFVVPSSSDIYNDDYKTSWSCQDCGTEFKGALIKSTVDRVLDKINSWDPINLVEGEELLKKLQNTLAPQHYLLLELKQHLIPLYEQSFATDWSMRRKIEHCSDIIKVLRVIEPGISRLQGLALFQMHCTQINLANKLYHSKEIQPHKYLELLTEAEENLRQAIKFLLYEPKNSPEGRLVQHALNDLKILRSIIAQTKSLCQSKLNSVNDVLKNVPLKTKVRL